MRGLWRSGNQVPVPMEPFRCQRTICDSVVQPLAAFNGTRGSRNNGFAVPGASLGFHACLTDLLKTVISGRSVAWKPRAGCSIHPCGEAIPSAKFGEWMAVSQASPVIPWTRLCLREVSWLFGEGLYVSHEHPRKNSRSVATSDPADRSRSPLHRQRTALLQEPGASRFP